MTTDIDRPALAARPDWPDRIFDAFKRAGIRQVGYVPDAGHSRLIERCKADPDIRDIVLTTEEEGVALAAGAWLWGGSPETIAETIRVGINSTAKDTRTAQMMAFGRDGVLQREQVLAVVAYVRSLSGQSLGEPDQARVPAGGEVFAANCVACHGPEGKGLQDLGAPDLTDGHWIYGGDTQSIFNSVQNGRQGHMPSWEGQLSPTEIKLLALYVGTLSGEAK